MGGGVGEEVIDHAVHEGGELVQFLRSPVRKSGLHAAGADLITIGKFGDRFGGMGIVALGAGAGLFLRRPKRV